MAQRDPHFTSILTATRGVVFIAVPHDGADATALANRVGSIAQVVVNANLLNLNDLVRDSRPLQEISRDFAFLDSFPVVTITESEKTPIPYGLGKSVLVVPSSSASLRLGKRERVFSIEGADHHTVCKFQNRDDNGYRRVAAHLRDLADEAMLRGDKPTPPLASPGPISGYREAGWAPAANLATIEEAQSYFEIPHASSLNFTGRREYLDQISRLLPHGHCQQRMAIFGLRGAGKTQLAIRYAEENRSYYKGVFFINASTESHIVHDYGKLHSLLRLGSAQESEKPAQVRRWFSDPLNMNWLILFDNAERLDTLNLFKYIPVSNGHIIITTLDHRVQDSDLVGNAIELGMLNLQESVDLLRRRAGRDALSEDELYAAKEIAGQVEGLPLALDSAAGFVHHRKKTFCEYLQQYGDRAQFLLSYRPSMSIYDKSVFTSLDMNLDVVYRENPRAAMLFLVFAHLDRSKISLELLRQGTVQQQRIGRDGESYGMTPEQGCVDKSLVSLLSDEMAFGEAIETLLSLSLIHQTKESTDMCSSGFSLHSLVQLHARSRVQGEEREEVIWRALSMVAQAFPFYILLELHSPLASICSNFKAFTRLHGDIIPHIRACCENIESVLLCDDSKAISKLSNIKCESQPSGDWTLLRHASSLFLGAYFAEAPYYELHGGCWTSRYMHLVDSFLKGQGSEYLHALRLRNQLSILYREGNYAEAIELAKGFLLENHETFINGNDAGPSISPEPLLNAELGHVIITLVKSLVTEADAGGAEVYREGHRLLDLCRAVNTNCPSRAERAMLSSRNRIQGRVFRDQGNWEDSARCFQTYCTHNLHPGSSHAGWALADWAHVLMELGRNREAEKVIEELLRERLLGESQAGDMPTRRASDTILLQINFAEARLRQGFLEESEDQFKEVLEKMLSLGPLEHCEKTKVFFLYCGLARVAHLTCRWVTAKARWDTAFSYGLTLKRGSKHESWGRTYFYQRVVLYSIADVHYELGEVEEAVSLRQEVEISGTLDAENRMHWMLGLGTYWLDSIEERMKKRG
ncbi:hypothetical protein FGG08_004143 [Glutinoglossum americanum]|uniref:NB-ARC domain-containing protein n=1 Tax=Glutinoglossum americanum TaxID=1670608 RepID=A0A9P8I5P4_9PEZI|nr:hypothetical protein FGG08_004143 [Glutinoglossum americanum]